MDFQSFMKKNKQERPHVFFPASEDFRDEKGEKIPWELRPLTTRMVEEIREEARRDSLGRQNAELLFTARLIAAAVVFPDLENAELQDSYGVKTPQDLLLEMLDNPAEFQALSALIREMSGFNRSLSEEVKEAKN